MSTPVLIVGCGPSGLFLANLLGSQNIQTVCIERNATCTDHPKSTFLDSEIVRLLDTIGLLDTLKGQIIGLSGIERYSPSGTLVSREDNTITSHNYPHRNTMYQPWLEQALLDGLSRFPCVSVKMNCELIDIQTESTNSVKLKCTFRDIQTDTTTTSVFQYVIGADGNKSKVRDLMGLSFDPVTDYEAKSIRIDVEGMTDTTLVMRSGIHSGRNWISFPAPNGRRFSFTVLPGEHPEDLLTDEAAFKLLQPHIENNPHVRILFRSHYHFRSRLASSLRKGNIFLIGDAAHTLPPANAQGLNSGARDANALAWRLAEVLKGGSSLVLDEYEIERYEPMKQIILNASIAYQAARKPTSSPSGTLHSVKKEEKSVSIYGQMIPNAWVQLVGTRKGVMLDTLFKPQDSNVSYGWNMVGFNSREYTPTGYNSIVLYRRGVDIPSLPCIQGIICDHRFDNYWNDLDGKWILVRPDRVVQPF